jgi:hypothetical protein
MRLKLVQSFCVIDGFEKTADGGSGEVERDGRVVVGDCLVMVNEEVIAGKQLQEIQQCIVSAGDERSVRQLCFQKVEWNEAGDGDGDGDGDARSGDIKSTKNQRALQFQAILEEGNKVNEGKLRNMAVGGIPDQEPSLRPIVWRILLNYLPLDRRTWPGFREDRVLEYETMCKKYFTVEEQDGSLSTKLILPSGAANAMGTVTTEKENDRETDRHTDRNDDSRNDDSDGDCQGNSDHPLSTTADSAWSAYFSDISLMEEIDKDVIRTHPVGGPLCFACG